MQENERGPEKLPAYDRARGRMSTSSAPRCPSSSASSMTQTLSSSSAPKRRLSPDLAPTLFPLRGFQSAQILSSVALRVLPLAIMEDRGRPVSPPLTSFPFRSPSMPRPRPSQKTGSRKASTVQAMWGAGFVQRASASGQFHDPLRQLPIRCGRDVGEECRSGIWRRLRPELPFEVFFEPRWIWPCRATSNSNQLRDSVSSGCRLRPPLAADKY